MARIHPPLENWRRVSGEIRTEPLISSGNIRRLQREERPRGDPAGRSPRRLPSRPRKAKYISGAVYQHTLRHTDLALRKPKKRTKIECSKYWCHYGTEKSLTQTFKVFIMHKIQYMVKYNCGIKPFFWRKPLCLSFLFLFLPFLF